MAGDLLPRVRRPPAQAARDQGPGGIGPTFVLVHSPLVGPSTWKPVADELRARGLAVVVPSLTEGRPGEPYWRQHAEAVAAQVPAAASSLVVVGHSGACPLLPAIGAALAGSIAAYVLVDGDLPLVPEAGSRLDLLRDAAPPLADELEAILDAGGAFPTWSDEDLREEIPNPELRARVVAEAHPRPRPFWEEHLPPAAGWPDAPCGYLELSAHYGAAAGRARSEGWAYRHLPGRHFEMLNRPAEIVDAIVDLASGSAARSAHEHRWPTDTSASAPAAQAQTNGG